jgi:hypothetical protein
MKWGIVAIISIVLTGSSTAATQRVYEDDRISVAVRYRWSQMSTASADDTGAGVRREPIGAAFSDGNFAIYLLTHWGQASGIEGGRFNEIAYWVAPWANLEQMEPCIPFVEEATTKVTDALSRVDLYFDTKKASAAALADCGNPSIKAVLWYGSYFTQRCPAHASTLCADGGFFLYFPSLAHTHDEPQDVDHGQMAFTLTFRTANPDQLPRKGDPSLQVFLNRASKVVAAIRYKRAGERH